MNVKCFTMQCVLLRISTGHLIYIRFVNYLNTKKDVQ
jgi:hypothetical protein